MFQIKVVGKNQNTCFMFSNFFPENRAVYEIMSKNMVESERLQIAIWRRVACWISKATHAEAHLRARAPTPTRACTCTHTKTTICNTYCFPTAKAVSRTRLNITLYVYCQSCSCRILMKLLISQ